MANTTDDLTPKSGATIVSTPTMNNVVINLQDQIRQNSDIRGGREEIISNSSLYFTQLDLQSDDQFAAMVRMAPVYILYPKIVDGFTGTIFSKRPNLTGMEFTDSQKEYNKNVDLMGNSIDEYAESVISDVLENGFCATVNDYSDSLKRPYLQYIKPSQFVSFRTNSDAGYPKISQFIFKEEIQVEVVDDEFDTEVSEQYTVFDLAPNPKNNDALNYRVRIYQGITPTKEGASYITTTSSTGVKSTTVSPIQGYSGSSMQLTSSTFPVRKGKPFDTIPVTIHGARSNNFTISKSIIQDLSDMNISIMQRVVDQTYMLHWTALPTPYIIGSDSDDSDSPNSIGPSRIWHISNHEAKVGMLEFSGTSAKAHQDFIDNLKDIMAATGAQILKKEGVSRETATSVLVRSSAQTSLIATLVKNTSAQMKRVLTDFFLWSGNDKVSDFDYKINDDFVRVDMEPNAQIALVKSWLDGAISHETMFNKMKEGELIDPNKTFEEEIIDIEKNPPSFFAKQVDAELAETEQEEALPGSNLENENVDNKQATEQV